MIKLSSIFLNFCLLLSIIWYIFLMSLSVISKFFRSYSIYITPFPSFFFDSLSTLSVYFFRLCFQIYFSDILFISKEFKIQWKNIVSQFFSYILWFFNNTEHNIWRKIFIIFNIECTSKPKQLFITKQCLSKEFIRKN